MNFTTLHDSDSERALLGACMIDGDVTANLLPTLGADDFYSPRHQVIAEAMRTLLERGDCIDEAMAGAALREAGAYESAGSMAYLAELVDLVPTAVNAGAYARRVRDMSLRRSLVREATRAAEAAQDQGRSANDILDAVAGSFAELAAGRPTGTAKTAAELVANERTDIERRSARGAMQGLPTGYIDLDAKLSGLQPGDLVLLAARPSMGKTALATGIAAHAALRAGAPVLFFSAEMMGGAVLQRMLACEGRIDTGRLRAGKLKDFERVRYEETLAAIERSPLIIDEGSQPTVLDIRTRARRHRQRHGLALVVVDYLQLIRAPHAESREREIAEVSQGLKSIAKELAVPVLALSQLNRSVESRTNKRPMLSDLRDSGSLEQDADVVMFIYRDDYYVSNSKKPGVAEIEIAKHRNGPTDVIELRWLPEYTQFQNIARSEQSDPPHWADCDDEVAA